MTQREAKYWGKIDEADAARAESILEQGEKEKPGRIPFVNITVADAPEIKTVRESVERALVGQEIRWGIPSMSQDWNGKVPGTSYGQAPGVVVLSGMQKLPWEVSPGDSGKRGGIYTWDQITHWDCEAGKYFLLFHVSTKGD